MVFQRISSKLSVCPQIATSDLPKIKAAGFKGIICNRPDGEGANQPSFAKIEKAAYEIGLAALYVPVQPGAASKKDVTSFRKALEDLESPVLAYCGSGMRSASLWSLLHER
ncbi:MULTISPECIES: TIGR01244 family sulfur transferase [unclassified Leisingera]|uniref:TIGR01244 family sulfur transferase n=1 Tax=unclassified Leisingera TaxID=2614906 RepID=UPI0009E362AC|nr:MULTISPECIES: TIGR01244 family sulfur transferase [unclassified Leisingera]